MASYRVHILGGMGAYLLFLLALTYLLSYRPSWEQGTVLLGVTLLAALFPDVDTSSKARRWFYLAFLVLDAGLLLNGNYFYAALLGLFALLPMVGAHRGWTHTAWAMVLVPLPSVFLPYLFLHVSPRTLAPYYAGAVVGYFSHLALDRKL